MADDNLQGAVGKIAEKTVNSAGGVVENGIGLIQAAATRDNKNRDDAVTELDRQRADAQAELTRLRDAERLRIANQIVDLNAQIATANTDLAAERAAIVNLRTANTGLQGDVAQLQAAEIAAKRNLKIVVALAIIAIVGLFIYFKMGSGNMAIQPVSAMSVAQPATVMPANIIPAPMPQPAAVTIKTALEYPYNQCLGGTQAKRRSEVEPCCNQIGEALGGQYGNNCLEIMRLLFVSPPPPPA